jgi:PAS domain S-box-containing protein
MAPLRLRWFKESDMSARLYASNAVNGADSPQRKELEELRIKEAVIASSLSAMMITDLDGCITYVNPAFLRLWAYESREEILGRQLADFVIDAEQAREMLQPLRRHGSWAGEHVAVRKNGTLRVVQRSATVVTNLDGEPLCLASSFMDITDRKHVEQSLRTSEARYRNIVEAVPVGITLTDERGIITYYSARARAMFGVADDQVALGTNYRRWIAQGQLENELRQGAGNPGTTPLTELRLLRADGSEFWGEVTSVLIEEEFAGAGRPRGSIIVVQDISARKQANEALARYAAELERSNQELEQFAYVASHDLQEPLRMVASYVQLLSKDFAGELGPEADEYIGFAVDGARRMQRLIDDLLAFSRVGTRGRQFEPVDCNQVLQDVLRSLKLAIDEVQAQITYDFLPTVQGDRGQIYQLFQNLLANALKFHGSAPPAIEVGAVWQPSGASTGSSSGEEGAGWLFSVRDNGIGIEPQYFDRIFVIFQRLHSRAHYSGTGIGLAICKKIVERHGGRIWVESTPGEGATFYFRLPERALHAQPLRNGATSW